MSETFPGVRVVAKSANRKLGPVDYVTHDFRNGKAVELKRARLVPRPPFVAATYLSIQGSCDDTCVFKNGNGCFAESGYSKLWIRKLDAEVRGKKYNLGVIEARAIDTLFPRGVPQDGGRHGTSGRDLRLHVSGDALDETGAAALALAAMRWRSRGGGTVWGYTHSWRRISRFVWGKDIQMFASCETAADVEQAKRKGYAPALVVRKFDSHKVFSLRGTDTKFFPCLAETRKSNCAECRACFNTEGLLEKNLGVAFAVHGVASSKARRRLPILNSLFGTLP